MRDGADYLAPDGSEIRHLLEDEAGGFAHCSLAQGACSQAVRHTSVHEIWFVLGGTGTIWRMNETGDTAEDLLRPGRCVTIPVETSFQFRADGQSPLRIGIGTFPRWPGEGEAEPVEGSVGGRPCWQRTDVECRRLAWPRGAAPPIACIDDVPVRSLIGLRGGVPRAAPSLGGQTRPRERVGHSP